MAYVCNNANGCSVVWHLVCKLFECFIMGLFPANHDVNLNLDSRSSTTSAQCKQVQEKSGKFLE